MNQENLKNKVASILNQLSLEEKASLCAGRDSWSTRNIDRLGLPWIWLADGPHGVRRAPDTEKPGYGDQEPATCFPTASALAATWDVDLIQEVGRKLGIECQALGVHVLLGPGANIKRSVLGGRNFEFFSEDPVLAGEMAAAFINGVQSQGVGTSLKHFVANNVETGRMYTNSAVDLRTFHEIYLTPFEIAIKKAQPWTVMACYNRVRGEYGTQSDYLLQKTLLDDWGFEGIVISDWFAVVDRVKGLKAGMHLEMPGLNQVNNQKIIQAIHSGQLSMQLLDQRVRDILELVLKADALEKHDVQLPINAHHQFARQVASQAITLLKNEAKLLPITPQKYQKIAIIGEFAVNPRYQGNGSSEVKPTKLDNVWEILKQEFGEAYAFSYAQGYSLKDDEDLNLIKNACRVAEEADLALIFAGLPLQYESEGIDRTHINMPKAHNQLISEVAKVQKNSAVILTNGSAVAMPWVNEPCAIVESWLGGQAGAGGVVDVLFGKVNPSGKLAETFPVRLEDTPAYLNFPGEEGEALYGERIFVGYRYYAQRNIAPLFPFGHGLSYTDFKYSDLKLSTTTTTDQQGLDISIVIENVGKRHGKEIVQLYVRDIESQLLRPKQELKKFKKVDLQPGEKKVLSFHLSARDFSYFDSKRELWIAESGEFEIRIGSSSRDIRSTGIVQLKSNQRIPLGFDEYTFFSEYWKHPETKELLKQLVPKWISWFVPPGKTLDDAQFQDFFIDHPIIKLPYLTHGEVTADDINDFVKKCQNITTTP